MRICITIPGEPCAQGRPRFSTVNGHAVAFDPEKSRNYKALVKYIVVNEIKKQGWIFTESSLVLTVRAFMGVAASKSKKFKAAALSGAIRPTKKPDLDNIVKIIKDALSKVLYKDDSYIVSTRADKYYSDNPRVEVELELWTPEHDMDALFDTERGAT